MMICRACIINLVIMKASSEQGQKRKIIIKELLKWQMKPTVNFMMK